jgi:hypothetical protein
VVVGAAFVVAGAASASADPGEGAFDDPAAGQDVEAVASAGVRGGAWDDLEGDVEDVRGGRDETFDVVALVGPDVADSTVGGGAEQGGGGVLVGDVGGSHHDVAAGRGCRR